ncbi:hypothetical protein AA313_de0209751 [Arthrobotrys entomopaga]|nr:hypothetical protein AA313_de0209751 [Arthrobotrys entomopaga]
MGKVNLPCLSPEILDMIYSDLSYDSLLAVSVCSKTDRRISIPYLFRGIKLSVASLKALENNGSLSHLNHKIRDVVFSDLDHASEFVQNVGKCRLYCDSLRLFPNITGLHVSFAAPDDKQTALRIAIFRAAAQWPWFQKLKSLSIDYVSIPAASLHYLAPEAVKSSLGPKELSFLIPSDRDPTKADDIPTPEFLTSASATAMVSLSAGARNGSTDPLALFYSRSFATLKHLKLKTHPSTQTYEVLFPRYYGVSSRQQVPEVLPLITKLELTLHAFDFSHVSGIPHRFRNLEELRIDASNRAIPHLSLRVEPLEGAVYYHFILLRQLKRGRIPWPLTDGDTECDVSVLKDTMEFLTTDQETRAEKWGFRFVNNNGLTKLEYIDFVGGYEEADDKFWFIYGDSLEYKGCDMTIARVYRDLRVEIRTERGHRKGLAKPVRVNC